MTDRRFERMVIGLPQGAGDNSAIRSTADLAERLHIELLGTFIADANLRSLTETLGRELRMHDLQWQPIDLARLSHDLENVIDFVRNRFVESVGKRAIKTSFEVVAGAQLMGSVIRANDIVAIIEPGHPGERITQQFTDLLDAVFDTAAAVLVVPRRILRASGPITAVAESGDDPSIRAALEIAAALRERLVITIQSGALPSADILAHARRLGVEMEQVPGEGASIGSTAAALSLSRSKERLRVMSRSRRSDDLRRLFPALHGVPLLLVEAQRAETAASQNEEAQGREQA